jgi:large conductance mechanosensitive channel
MADLKAELMDRSKAVSGFAKEFREFITRGSVIDMAIGIIIGGIFGKIVTSLVNDVLMPPIGLLLAKIDFRDLKWLIREPVKDAADPAKILSPGVTISYGAFINTVIDFIIAAFVIFLLIKVINRVRRAPEATTRDCPRCCSAISKKATRCPHCTSEVESVPVA